MSTRSILIGLFVVVLMCGGLLFGVTYFFGRDADMRSAEIAFNSKYGPVPSSTSGRPASGTQKQPTSAAAQASKPAASDDLDDWYGESAGSKSKSDLDSWYAAAGASDGPADTTPEDKSYLVNDTQPLVSTDPL